MKRKIELTVFGKEVVITIKINDKDHNKELTFDDVIFIKEVFEEELGKLFKLV